MIRSSEELGELAKALSVVQGLLEGVKRDQTGDKYKYADLAQCIEMGKDKLADNGLSIVQFPGSTDNGDMKLSTRLMHESGQWIEDDFDMPVVIPISNAGKEMMSAPQAAGSTLTYMRRYALSSVLGIAQEDDDAAQGKEGTTYRKQQPDDDKEWYNTVDDDKNGIISAMVGGRTADQIIANLRDKWKVSKKTAEIIRGYSDEAKENG